MSFKNSQKGNALGPGAGSGWVGLHCKTPLSGKHLENALEEGRNGWGATTEGPLALSIREMMVVWIRKVA